MKKILFTVGSFLMVIAVLAVQERGGEALTRDVDVPVLVSVPKTESLSPSVDIKHGADMIPARILIGTTTSSRKDETATLTLNVQTTFIHNKEASQSPPQLTHPITPSSMKVPQSPSTSIPAHSIPTHNKLTWGVFAGSNPSDIDEFEERIEINPDYLAIFIHWANHGGDLYSFLPKYAKHKDRKLIIFWEASDYIVGGTHQPTYAYRTILRGDHDVYLRDFARQIREYDDDVILIPFSELNGDWTPWSGTRNGNTPEEAVEAYRYVHGFFEDVPNVKFGLALNARSFPDTPENSLTAYYPGDAFVDYIGLDGFNDDDPWESFESIFAPGLNTISQYGKPLFIFSFGSAEGERKAVWLENAFTHMEKYPLMKGFIYFNQNKERNWLLWSDKKTLMVFKDYVRGL